MGFIIQAGILLGILYFAPWFGSIKDEARMVAASVAAVVGSGLLSFLWEVLRAPAQMHREQEGQIEDLRAMLKLDCDAEAVTKETLALCAEARKMAHDPATLDHPAINEWKARTLVLLREHYHVGLVYEFQNEVRYRVRQDGAEPLPRIEFLADILEGIALSFGSKAQAAQQAFRPRLKE